MIRFRTDDRCFSVAAAAAAGPAAGGDAGSAVGRTVRLAACNEADPAQHFHMAEPTVAGQSARASALAAGLAAAPVWVVAPHAHGRGQQTGDAAAAAQLCLYPDHRSGAIKTTPCGEACSVLWHVVPQVAPASVPASDDDDDDDDDGGGGGRSASTAGGAAAPAVATEPPMQQGRQRRAGGTTDANAGGPPVRVLCWVQTHKGVVDTRARTVHDTWGSDCDVLLFVTTEKHPGLDVMVVDLPGPESRDYLWDKAKDAWHQVYRDHLGSADWFIKADDDTYVNIPHLKRHLRANARRYNASDAHYMGRVMNFAGDATAPFIAGGSGTRREPVNYTPMGVNSISSGSPHVRPMGRTCGEPDEIKRNTHPKRITAFFRDHDHDQASC